MPEHNSHPPTGASHADVVASWPRLVDQAVGLLLDQSRHVSPDALPVLVASSCQTFGGTDAQMYLADIQERTLVPLQQRSSHQHSYPQALEVESTLAGRSFQHSQRLRHPHELSDMDEEVRLWLPLSVGAERLGVLGMTLSADLLRDREELEHLDRYAAVVASLLSHNSRYGDSIVRTRRTSAMTLAAEVQWSLLPPLTYTSRAVTVAGGLEPAYEVAGDSLDYAVDADVARFAVFDGMGHGIISAQLISLAVAAYRNARREGQSLIETAAHIESAVAEVFRAESFATGVMCELDLSTGWLTFISAGHHEPLLFRDRTFVRALSVEPMLPLGLNHELARSSPTSVGGEQLEPGDTVLLYTDGVIEARSPDNSLYGSDRLIEQMTRSLADDVPAPETMRRLVHALLAHQSGDLDDDATVLQVTWHGTSAPAAG